MRPSFYRFLLIPLVGLFLSDKAIEPLSLSQSIDVTNICITAGEVVMIGAVAVTILKSKHRATFALIGTGFVLEAAAVIIYGILQHKYQWEVTFNDLQVLPVIMLILFDLIGCSFILHYFRTHWCTTPVPQLAGGVI